MEILQVKNKRRNFIAYILGVLICWGVTEAYHIIIYWYDSWLYVEFAKAFFDSAGKFSFQNYFEVKFLRGYFFPFFLSSCVALDNVFQITITQAYRYIASLWTSAICTVAFPAYIELLSNSKRSIGLLGRLGILAAVLVFWPGLVVYPFSDFYGFSFLLLGLILAEKYFACANRTWTRLLTAFLCGFFLYAAYNTRTIYLFAVLCVIPIAIVRLKKPKEYIKFFLVACIGFLICAIPEAIFNYEKNRGGLSILVNTQIDAYSNGLNTSHLFEGMRIQLYVGGDVSGIRKPGVIITDSVGQRLYEIYDLSSRSIGLYISLLFKEPLSMLGIYWRHLMNLLNPVFGIIYTYDIAASKVGTTIANYLLMSCSVTYLIYRFSMQAERKHFFVTLGRISPLVLPCLIAALGSVETRFFFPIYMLMYGLLCGCVRWKELWVYFKQRWLKILVIMVICFIAYYSTIDMTWSIVDNGLPMLAR